jgi:hypothetical protein
MTQLLRFHGAAKLHPEVEQWFSAHDGVLGVIARRWFEVMRKSGSGVRELLHDGAPTACIGDAGFAYVNVFRAHVNVGFFRGATLADPAGLLEGTGRFMRHVKLRADGTADAKGVKKLIEAAYADMKKRVKDEAAAGEFKEATTSPVEVNDGAKCKVVKGVHAGKTGTARDIKTSKTGHVTMTLVLPDGDRVKTLARNVTVLPR